MSIKNKVQLLLTFGSLATASATTPRHSLDDIEDDTPLPLVIWHGLGDDYASEGMKSVAALVESIHPGTFIYPIQLDTDPSRDRSDTFLGNLTEQVDLVCSQLASHPILSTAPAIDALGFSQGGIFLRAYVERCNRPRIRSLVTFGAPHNGIAALNGICRAGDWLCHGAMALLQRGTWTATAQGHLVPAQYFRDPSSAEAMDEYLAYSNFLADVNNERADKNATYADNLAALDNLAMYLFAEDTMIVPKESAWFEEINGTESIPLRARAMYKEDWIGLRRLDRKGGLQMRTMPGEHMHLDDEILIKAMKEFYGPAGKRRIVEENGRDGEL